MHDTMNLPPSKNALPYTLRYFFRIFEREMLIRTQPATLLKISCDFLLISKVICNTVEPVYIEHSRQMKKCSMYAGVQCEHQCPHSKIFEKRISLKEFFCLSTHHIFR